LFSFAAAVISSSAFSSVARMLSRMQRELLVLHQRADRLERVPGRGPLGPKL
jgi:hypothetical protein